MVKVENIHSGSIDGALRRLRRAADRENIFSRMREKEAYTKPSIARHLKAVAAQKRHKKRKWKEEMARRAAAFSRSRLSLLVKGSDSKE